MDEKRIELKQGESWFTIQRPDAPPLAFEEWEGKVPRINSRMLQDKPACVICNAQGQACAH